MLSRNTQLDGALEKNRNMYDFQQAEASLGGLSDGLLAHQALNGDEAAFETLVKRYSSPLFHFIYHLLGDYDGACDVLQLVMVQLYTSLPALHQEKSFKPWLFKVAHNRAVDELRKRHSIHFSELESDELDEAELAIIVDGSPLPQEVLEFHELQQLLQRAIRQLPELYRDVVLLRYLWQLTFPEIGNMTGMPEATAKTYFHRAKRLLREAIQAEHLSELLPGR